MADVLPVFGLIGFTISGITGNGSTTTGTTGFFTHVTSPVRLFTEQTKPGLTFVMQVMTPASSVVQVTSGQLASGVVTIVSAQPPGGHGPQMAFIVNRAPMRVSAAAICGSTGGVLQATVKSTRA